MPADGALAGVCGIAFAVELEEGPGESRVSSASAIIPFEGCGDVGGHIGPAGRQIGISALPKFFTHRRPLAKSAIPSRSRPPPWPAEIARNDPWASQMM